MHIAIVAFDGFTDIDLFLPWDLLNRVCDPRVGGVRGWQVAICADTPQITSASGLTINRGEPLSWVRGAQGVFIVSGPGSRSKLYDDAFLAQLALDPALQIIAAIDSGVLILAKLGLLDGLSATTYPTVFPELEAMGVRAERQPIVVHGNIATGGGCLSCQDLAGFIIERLTGAETAKRVVQSIAKVSAEHIVIDT